jgi:RNA polymerase sigma-70 factor (ECF subfamily)
LNDDVPEVPAHGSETADRVHATLDRLPPRYARAMEWRYLDGVDVPEIARRLDLSYKAAESLLSRARSAFRETYERLGATPGAVRIADGFGEEEVAQ